MSHLNLSRSSGGGQRSGSSGEQGLERAGSGKRENRGREAGLNILKAVVCCLLLGIIQLKNLYSKSFEISI